MNRVGWPSGLFITPLAAPADGNGAAPADGNGAASADGNGAASDAPGPARLLLVDDSRTNRMLALSMLRKMGYEPVAVEDGKSAVEAVKNGGFAVVLMDVWMPGMDGFAATAAIRALPGPECGIPIIAMTADTDREDRRRCLDAGMNDFISKPVDRHTLAEMIKRLTGIADTPVAGEATGSGPDSDLLIDDGVLNQLRIDAGPELINDFVAAYMLETDDRLKRMADSAARGDLAAVAGDAHAMKSSSGTFGARRLHGQATAIETAVERGDASAAAELISGLNALVRETWRAFATRGMRPGAPPER